MGLGSLFDWFQEQVKYVLFFALLVALIYTAFQRAWIAMVGVIVGLAFIAIFIIQPEMIVDLGTWLSEKVRLGRR